jgi:hypothetical protein
MRSGRWALVGVVVLTGSVLTACEQPAPGITAFSGTNSVRAEALCWAFDADSLAPDACARDIIAGNELGGAPELPVNLNPGTVVGISVDKAVAEDGWVPALGGQRLVNSPITETYYRFTFPPTFPQAELPANGLGLQILSGPQTQLRGVWAVRLVNG